LPITLFSVADPDHFEIRVQIQLSPLIPYC
jgi:hypothetical protein